jgi:phage terminase small subunit
MAVLSKRTGVNQERIMRELARIGFADPNEILNMDEATLLEDVSKDDSASILSVKVKKIPTDEGFITEREIKFHDKVRALELLGKRFKMWTDRVETEVDAEITIKLEGNAKDWAE